MSGSALQEELNFLFGAGLVVDGVIGSRTLLAYDALSRPDKLLLEFELLARGVDMAKTIFTDGQGFRHPGYVYLRRKDIEMLVSRASELIDRPDLVGVILGFIDLEARSTTRGGERLYQVTSRSGSFRGLLQFNEASWSDAKAEVIEMNEDVDIGDYKANVYFPANNILAGMGYAVLASRIMIAKGIPVNAETLYVSHNQGPYFWNTMEPINLSGQSPAAKRLIIKYRDLYS